ncbi:hypothetical protein EIP91_011020 [Steccherinum ochraceum]|uniref:Uncharacterized protein n=1 Tax=Steccherinum ochraceum TaxID=92696 RepID=A0A4R0R245_9APHY|nr:hypothetical protein EIP91_011020 [Steccherinum ochraceum]
MSDPPTNSNSESTVPPGVHATIYAESSIAGFTVPDIDIDIETARQNVTGSDELREAGAAPSINTTPAVKTVIRPAYVSLYNDTASDHSGTTNIVGSDIPAKSTTSNAEIKRAVNTVESSRRRTQNFGTASQ